MLKNLQGPVWSGIINDPYFLASLTVKKKDL